MSCVFLSKSIPPSHPHSFLNKLADEFQSKSGGWVGVRMGGGRGVEDVGGGGRSFKACRVWNVLRNGVGCGRGWGVGWGPRLSTASPPSSLHPIPSVTIVYCAHGVGQMNQLGQDHSFVASLEKQTSTVTTQPSEIEEGQLKSNQWPPSSHRVTSVLVPLAFP